MRHYPISAGGFVAETTCLRISCGALRPQQSLAVETGRKAVGSFHGVEQVAFVPALVIPSQVNV